MKVQCGTDENSTKSPKTTFFFADLFFMVRGRKGKVYFV